MIFSIFFTKEDPFVISMTFILNIIAVLIFSFFMLNRTKSSRVERWLQWQQSTPTTQSLPYCRKVRQWIETRTFYCICLLSLQNCRVKSPQGDTKEVFRFHQHFVPHEEYSHGERCPYDFGKALRHCDEEQGQGGRGCPLWWGLPVSVFCVQDPVALWPPEVGWQGGGEASADAHEGRCRDPRTDTVAAIETHDLLSQKLFTHALPILFTCHSKTQAEFLLPEFLRLGNLRF